MSQDINHDKMYLLNIWLKCWKFLMLIFNLPKYFPQTAILLFVVLKNNCNWYQSSRDISILNITTSKVWGPAREQGAAVRQWEERTVLVSELTLTLTEWRHLVTRRHRQPHCRETLLSHHRHHHHHHHHHYHLQHSRHHVYQSQQRRKVVILSSVETQLQNKSASLFLLGLFLYNQMK